MRTRRLAIAAAILSAVVVAGCGGEEPTKVDMTGKADTAQFKGMLGDQMKSSNLKTGKPRAQ